MLGGRVDREPRVNDAAMPGRRVVHLQPGEAVFYHSSVRGVDRPAIDMAPSLCARCAILRLYYYVRTDAHACSIIIRTSYLVILISYARIEERKCESPRRGTPLAVPDLGPLSRLQGLHDMYIVL